MKKLFTLGLGFLMFNACVFAQGEETILIDSSTFYEWGASDWELQRTDYYDYSSEPTTRTRYDAIDPTRTILTYRSDGQEDETLNQTLTGDEWVDTTKVVRAYNGNGDILSATDFTWNAGTSSWDEIGVTESWTYDANGKLTENIEYQDYNGALVLNNIYNNYVYDEVTGLVTSNHRMRHNDDGTEKDFSIYEYTYNEAGLEIQEIQNRDKTAPFSPEEVEFYKIWKTEYDDNGERISYVYHKGTSFKSVRLFELTYDEHGNLTENIETESKDSITFVNVDRTLNYYSAHGPIGIQNTSAFIKAYPNPASTYINLPEGNYRFQLISISGSILFDDIRGNQSILNVSNLPSGMYFLRMKDERHSEVQKILIR